MTALTFLCGLFVLLHLEIGSTESADFSWSRLSRRAIRQQHAELNSNLIPVDESFSHFSQLQGELPFDRELSFFLFKSETKRLVCLCGATAGGPRFLDESHILYVDHSNERHVKRPILVNKHLNVLLCV